MIFFCPQKLKRAAVNSIMLTIPRELYPFIVTAPSSVYALLLACKQTNECIGILGQFTSGPGGLHFYCQWVGNDNTRFVRRFSKAGTATIHNPGHWVGYNPVVRQFEASEGPSLPKSVIYTQIGGNTVALPVDGTGWEGVKHPDLYNLTLCDNVRPGTEILCRVTDGAGYKWCECKLSMFLKGIFIYVRNA
jgi:hypothetical protein